jgi:hypothetical protein
MREDFKPSYEKGFQDGKIEAFAISAVIVMLAIVIFLFI